MTEIPEYKFVMTPTPKGMRVNETSPSGRTRKKYFRNGYASARLSAIAWIDDRKAVMQEAINTGDVAAQMIKVTVNGVTSVLTRGN